MENLLTSKETAEYLNIHEETVREWSRIRKLPIAGKVGREWRYRKSSLDDFLRRSL